MDGKQISLWCGKPLTDYTKEELIEIAEQAARLSQRKRDEDRAFMDFVYERLCARHHA